MSETDRITEVFETAKIIDFDDSSKYILFSDCHRGDNSWADDFARNEKIYFHALTHYYQEGFTYIEIGDGDELWENDDFEDIRSTHSHIFWLLRKFHEEKRLFIIWGNHNIVLRDRKYIEKNLYQYYDERESCTKPLFDGITTHEGLILRDALTKKRIFLFHGHQGNLLCDRLWRLCRFLVRHLWKHLQLLGVNDPTSPAKNYKKQLQYEQRILDWVKIHKEIVICGHTHRSMFPEPGVLPYFNTGSCVHPRCITGIEIQHREITLIKWWITADDDGVLRVKREVIEGPEKLEIYYG